MGKVFRFSQSLRFGHCDMAGIVFLSPFFDMVNATVEDWFERGLEFPFHDFHLKHRYGNPIVSTSCEFLHPCRYGEKMTLELGVASLGRSSIDLQISARVLGEERMRVRHKTAMISLGTFRSIAIPGELRAKMEQYAVVRGGEPDLPLPGRKAAEPENCFRSRQPIRYSHCDPSEIVYFPRFFDLFNAALEDWFAQALGSPWGSDFMGARNLRMPTLRIGCEFLRGCRLGETLDIELWPTRLGRSSLEFALAGKVDGETRMRVAWTLCVISFETFKSVAIPDDLRARMQPFLAPAQGRHR